MFSYVIGKLEFDDFNDKDFEVRKLRMENPFVDRTVLAAIMNEWHLTFNLFG